MADVKQQEKLSGFWMDFLMKEFKNETDRGAVVLTCSLVDNALTALLKKHLLPSPGSDDSLIDGSAPLSEFSSKIQMSQRLGLISIRLARDLHLIRKMRNEFAHSVYGSTLESGKIKSYLTTLISSSEIVKGHEPIVSVFPDGARGQFLKVANLILFHLHEHIEGDKLFKLSDVQDEWIYSWFYKPVPPPEVAQNGIAQLVGSSDSNSMKAVEEIAPEKLL